MKIHTPNEPIILTNRVHCLVGFPGQTKCIRTMYLHLTATGFWLVCKKGKLFIPHNKITSFKTIGRMFSYMLRDYYDQFRTGIEITYITEDDKINFIQLQFFVSVPISMSKNDAALKVMLAEMRRHGIFEKFDSCDGKCSY